MRLHSHCQCPPQGHDPPDATGNLASDLPGPGLYGRDSMLDHLAKQVPPTDTGDPTNADALFDIQKTPDPHAINLRGTLGGRQCNVLIDCGATISFVSAEYVLHAGLETSPIDGPDIIVRLGDDSAIRVQRCLTDIPLYLGDHQELKTTFFVMKLARGCDVVLGFDLMIRYDFSIHPASKRVTADIDGKRVALAHMHTQGGDDQDEDDPMDAALERQNQNHSCGAAMASTASATTIDPSDSVGGVERWSQSTMTVTAAIVTFDEEDTAVVTENDQHAAADNDHHAPEDADMDTDVSEGPVVTESMTDQCGQTFTSHDPKARTFQGHRWCEIGCAESRYIFEYMSTSTTLRSE